MIEKRHIKEEIPRAKDSHLVKIRDKVVNLALIEEILFKKDNFTISFRYSSGSFDPVSFESKSDYVIHSAVQRY